MADGARNYFILGAAGGVGIALCRRLAATGAGLILAGRTSESLEKLAAELAVDFPGEFRTRVVDATDSGSVNEAFSEAGPVNGAVNLAGTIILKPAHLTTDDEWNDTISQNLTTAFNVLRVAAKAMMATGGSIVLVSTVAARTGLVNHEAIAAAKGGVEALTRSAAATYAGRGIRVNAVAPGLVRTSLAAKITSNELALKASTAMHPLGRIGEPGDVAVPIAWLLGGESGWVTGQVISVDGGMSAVRGK